MAIRGNPNWIKAKEERLAAEATTVHTIHEDGTYSNKPTAAPAVEPVKVAETPKTGAVMKPMDIFKVASGASYQILDIVHGGCLVYPCPYRKHPRVEDGEFWDWEKINKEKV